MSQFRIPTRNCIRIDFIRSLVVCMAFWVANSCLGQTGVQPPVGPEASWKSLQLDEIEAQKAWLSHWSKGSLSAEPQNTSQLPKLRTEPILQTRLATELRERLNWENTEQDEKDLLVLNQALAEHPNDIGLQQLQLHWLDHPIRRKGLLGQIEVSAVRLIDSLKTHELADPKTRLAYEFAMYRRARGLAYRELPDVVQQTPIDNPEQLNQQILSAYQELIAFAGKRRPEFILLEIRILRRSKYFGTALGMLEKYGSVIKPKWYLKKRRDLLKELGWEIPSAEAAAIYANEFPEEVAKEAARQQQAPPKH